MIRENATAVFQLRLTPSDLEKLKAAAKEEGISVSDFVRLAIYDRIEKQ